MRLALTVWRLDVYLVLGRIYSITWDDFEQTCLRMAWRGKPVLRWGWARNRSVA